MLVEIPVDIQAGTVINSATAWSPVAIGWRATSCSRATRRAHALGAAVIEVDDTRDPDDVIDLLEDQFAWFL